MNRHLSLLIIALHFIYSHSYDIEWLESGCDGSVVAYDPTTIDDNTPGTYLTNYAIMLFGIAAFYKLRQTQKIDDDMWMASFFLFTGLGFGLAGLCHQNANSTDSIWSPNSFAAMVRIAYVLILIGNNALIYVAIRFFTSTNTYLAKGYHIIYNLLYLLAILLTVYDVQIIASILTLGTNVAMIVIFLILRRRFSEEEFVFKALGFVLMILGTLFFFVLRGKCDPSGYENCFKDCPLPYYFNNCAVFHVLQLLGMIQLMVSEQKTPSSSFLKNDESKGGETKYLTRDRSGYGSLNV